MDDPLPKLLKWFRSAEQNACQSLKKRKTRKMIFSLRPMGGFQNNFTGMFLGWPSTKSAKIVPLHWTKWSLELKIEKTFKGKLAKMVLLCWTKWPPEPKIEKPIKQHLLQGQLADFKIISQKCSLDDPLPKLLKLFCSAKQSCCKS